MVNTSTTLPIHPPCLYYLPPLPKYLVHLPQLTQSGNAYVNGGEDAFLYKYVVDREASILSLNEL